MFRPRLAVAGVVTKISRCIQLVNTSTKIHRSNKVVARSQAGYRASPARPTVRRRRHGAARQSTTSGSYAVGNRESVDWRRISTKIVAKRRDGGREVGRTPQLSASAPRDDARNRTPTPHTKCEGVYLQRLRWLLFDTVPKDRKKLIPFFAHNSRKRDASPYSSSRILVLDAGYRFVKKKRGVYGLVFEIFGGEAKTLTSNNSRTVRRTMVIFMACLRASMGKVMS